MEAPPPYNSPYQTVPPGTPNTEVWGAALGWYSYTYLASNVVDQAIADMGILQGVAM